MPLYSLCFCSFYCMKILSCGRNHAYSFSFGAGIEAPAFVYASEVFPGAWRASGVAFSMSAVFFWSTLFTGVAAPAFANIGWYLYI